MESCDPEYKLLVTLLEAKEKLSGQDDILPREVKEALDELQRNRNREGDFCDTQAADKDRLTMLYYISSLFLMKRKSRFSEAARILDKIHDLLSHNEKHIPEYSKYHPSIVENFENIPESARKVEKLARLIK